MSRLAPLPPEAMTDLAEHAKIWQRTLGFVPNSMRIMARRPDFVRAFAALNAAIMAPGGAVEQGLKRLIGYVASHAAGCLYCQAHAVLAADRFGESDARKDAVWDYANSPLFTPAEKVALEFAQCAAQVPNAVDDSLFERLRVHWDEGQIVEILAVIAMFGFLNRWNDTMATPLEEPPAQAGARHLGVHGWALGKHTGEAR
jgi:uncharacterized peroxidase-related enzyme